MSGKIGPRQSAFKLVGKRGPEVRVDDYVGAARGATAALHLLMRRAIRICPLGIVGLERATLTQMPVPGHRS
jgi:hypothetical protein